MIGDGRVVGVIGTSCSVAAVVAAPILSEAGLVMISASNTAPSLTSDLRGNAGVHSHAGYYRTASNDLYQAQAVAEFVYSELGLRKMATIDDGDPYTSGFTGAFAVAFAELGGSVTAAAEISRGDSDMIPVLTGIAADGAEGLFFPVFPGEAAYIARQVGQVEGLEELVLIGSDSCCWRRRRWWASTWWHLSCASAAMSTRRRVRAASKWLPIMRRGTRRRRRRPRLYMRMMRRRCCCGRSRRWRRRMGMRSTSTGRGCGRR